MQLTLIGVKYAVNSMLKSIYDIFSRKQSKVKIDHSYLNILILFLGFLKYVCSNTVH